MSAQSILSVLDPEKYAVSLIGITQQGDWLTGPDLISQLKSGKTAGLTRVALLPETGETTLYAIHNTPEGQTLEPLTMLDVVFPVLHGTFGEDGTMQGLFELADIAYVGAGVLGSSVGMDKALFKDVMRANGLPVVESLLVTRKQLEQDPQEIITQAEAMALYPLFTKPANLGSSVGITKCRGRSDLYEGLMEAARFDRRILIERGIANAREIEVSVLGNDEPLVSVPGEIRPAGDFYTYASKYLDEQSELVIPAPLPEDLALQIRGLALRAYQATDCCGMARIDFLLDPRTQEVFLSEVNTIPGFTRISMYPKLWEASGISYSQLVDRLIELALERKGDRDRTERVFRRES